MNNDYIILFDENGDPYLEHKFGDRARQAWGSITNTATKYLQKIPNYYGKGRNLYVYTQEQANALRNRGRQAVNQARQTVSNASQNARATAQKAVNQARTVVNNTVQRGKNALNTARTAVRNTLNNAKNTISQHGKDTLSSIRTNANNTLNNAKSTISNYKNDTLANIKDYLGFDERDRYIEAAKRVVEAQDDVQYYRSQADAGERQLNRLTGELKAMQQQDQERYGSDYLNLVPEYRREQYKALNDYINFTNELRNDAVDRWWDASVQTLSRGSYHDPLTLKDLMGEAWQEYARTPLGKINRFLGND